MKRRWTATPPATSMLVVSPFGYAQGRLRRIQWTATVGKVPRLRSGRLRAHGVAGVLGEYNGNLQDGSGHNNLLMTFPAHSLAS
ncbi:MAG: hypothetical protein ACYTAO_06500 [Planctomycetota bacterium]